MVSYTKKEFRVLYAQTKYCSILHDLSSLYTTLRRLDDPEGVHDPPEVLLFLHEHLLWRLQPQLVQPLVLDTKDRQVAPVPLQALHPVLRHHCQLVVTSIGFYVHLQERNHEYTHEFSAQVIVSLTTCEL